MKTAVVICPGRGTYNKAELGYLSRHFRDEALLDRFDAMRAARGQETLRALDTAVRFEASRHTRGDNASALIYAATIGDSKAINDVEVVAVTGNSMGWYSALACGGALSREDGFAVVNTMGTLMQEAMRGGQLIYPFVDDDWRPQPERKADLLRLVKEIDSSAEKTLALSIDLGGMLVIAGDEAGLSAFEDSVPRVQDRFPMRLPNHAAFHTHLQAPVAQAGQDALSAIGAKQPEYPLIDGCGQIWWPGATDTVRLMDYTLGHQVTEPYDFTHAIRVAAREFAPDYFVITGPGTTLGGAVIQSLILCNWKGLRSKPEFQVRQSPDPFLVSMAMEEQRAIVVSQRG